MRTFKVFVSIIIFFFSIVWVTQTDKPLKANFIVRMPVPKACKDKNGNIYSYATGCDGLGDGCDMDDCPKIEQE